MTEKLDPRAAGARRLKDKVCIVTGAGQGIGRAIARRLGQEGGKIVVADRIDEGARRTVKDLQDLGVGEVKVIAALSTLSGAQDMMAVKELLSQIKLQDFSQIIEQTDRLNLDKASAGFNIRSQ